jgi:hypothetical protein
VVGVKFEAEDYINQSNTQLVDSTLVSWLIGQIHSLEKLWFGKFGRQDRSAARLQGLIRRLARETISRQGHWISSVTEKLDRKIDVCNPWDCEIFNVFWSTIMLLELAAEELAIEAICKRKAIFKQTLSDQLVEERRPIPLSWLSKPAVEELAAKRGVEELSFEQRNSVELHIGQGTSKAIELSLCHSRHIAEGLRILGRCPTLLRRTTPSPLEVYMLMSFPCYSGASHGECGNRNCKAFNICEESYQMRHTRSCSQHEHCPIHRIDYKSLENLVDGDCNAVVRSRVSGGDILEVEIIDGAKNLNVTAISHVWAGGLGNFKANGHYHCQLKQLHQYLVKHRASQRRSSTVYYWLDTLCIPAREGLLKIKAINAMAFSYAKCKSVLVIDPDLSTINTDCLDARQLKLALLSSPWMARSWTLQEAALSVKLDFVFADRIVPFAELDNEDQLSDTTLLQSLWKRDVSLWAPERSPDSVEGWPNSKGLTLILFKKRARIQTLGQRESL